MNCFVLLINMGRIIGVFSGKGGVGKTTTVANLGSALSHDFGRKVIAIDANTSGSSLGIHLGMHFNPLTLNNVLKGDVEVWSAISEHGSGMWVLPSSIKLKDYFVDHSRLPKIIKKTSKRFDIVLIDTAPTLGDETLWVLNAIEEAILVINPDLPSVVESLKMAKLINNYGVKILGVVVNRDRKNAPLGDEQIENLMGLPIISKISDDKDVEKSIKYNVPVVHMEPYSKSALSFKKLAADIVDEKFQKPSFVEFIRWRLGW